MDKKELLKKTNWTRKDIEVYFSLSYQQVKNYIRKGNIKSLKVNSKMFAIDDVLKAFGTNLEREIKNTEDR